MGIEIIGAIIAAGASIISAQMAADDAEAAREQQQRELDRQRQNAAWVKENSKPNLTGASVAGTKALEGIDPNMKNAIDNGMDEKLKKLEGLDAQDLPQGNTPASAPPADAAPYSAPKPTAGPVSMKPNSMMPSSMEPVTTGNAAPPTMGLLGSAMQANTVPANSLDAAVANGSVPYAAAHPEASGMSSPLFTPEQTKLLTGVLKGVGNGAMASAQQQSKLERDRIVAIQRQMAEEELARRRMFQNGLKDTRIMGANVG